jgi:hypothetical protein
VRSYVRLADLPVFIITGAGDDELLAKMPKLGVKNVFQKGRFELRDVLEAIESELGVS